MSPQVPEIIAQIGLLPPQQRAEVFAALQRQFSEAIPAVIKTPGVCGGSARIIRTRIPVWLLERLRQLGVSDAEMLDSYPTLSQVDLAQAWAYAAAHREEVEGEIVGNEQDDDR